MNDWEMPKKVYRYEDWENEIDLNPILVKREIRLAKPSDFAADYPECSLPNDYSQVTEENLNKLAYQRATQWYPNLIGKNLRKEVQRLRSEMKIEDPEHRRESERINNEYLDQVLGVFCTALTFEDIQIWEHIGDLGQKICIAFHTEKLWKFEKMYGSAKHVDYYPFDKPPKLSPFSFSPEERIKKAIDRIYSIPDKYAYEQEFRFAKLGTDKKKEHPQPYSDEGRIVKLPKEVYSELILGYGMSDSDKKEVKKARDEYFPELPIWELDYKAGKIVIAKQY